MLKNLYKDPVISETRIWLSMALALIPMLVLFFKPTLLEFFAFYGIDLLAYMICQAVDISLYHRIWPQSRLFFPDLHPEILEMKALPEKQNIYREMLRFPWDRARFIAAVSTVKVIPGFIFILFVWRGDDPLWMACLKALSIAAFTFSYLIGSSCLGYHNKVSAQLKEIHEKADWSDVFRQTDLISQQEFIERVELITASSVWAFWTLMMGLILTTPGLKTWEALLQGLIISAAGFYFMAQLAFASRKQIIMGLEDLVRFHARGEAQNRPKGLALSTNRTLAFYQKTLNEWIERHDEQEKEIHRWILRQAENSRYAQLGRLTGLLAHDLLTPLTIMRYSFAALDEQKAFEGPHQTHAERLRFSLDQTTDIIKNIRSSIRDQSTAYREASLIRAHENARTMVSYLFDPVKLSSIVIDCQIEPHLTAAIPQPELNQVLLNLYSNAVTNLVEHGVTAPRVSLRKFHENDETFTLVIKDNGSGLAAATFHYITEEAERLPGYEGIGLKLTKCLIELYGGSLKLIQPSDKVGAEFHLTLRKVEVPRQEVHHFAARTLDPSELRTPVS